MKTNTVAPSDPSKHRVVATSLRPGDIAVADRIAQALRAQGWPHANRSLVIREALTELSETLQDQSPHQVFMHFIRRLGKRLPPEPDSHAA